MSNFAILRIQKLATFSKVQSASWHNLRGSESVAPNADPSRENQNQYFGSKDPVSAIKSVHEKYQIKPRKNACIATEYLLTASPEAMQNMSAKTEQEWIKSNIKWLKDRHGDGLVSVVAHRDESTLHLQAIVTPIYRNEKGKMKLSATHFFDGSKQLQAMQDDYAEAMKPFGLDRGVRNSKAKHKELKTYYAELDSTLENAESRTRSILSKTKKAGEEEPGLFNYKTMYSELLRLTQHVAAQLRKATKAAAALKKKSDEKIERLEARVEALERSNKRFYELIGLYPPGSSESAVYERLEAFSRTDAPVYQKELREFERSIDQQITMTAAKHAEPVDEKAVKQDEARRENEALAKRLTENRRSWQEVDRSNDLDQ